MSIQFGSTFIVTHTGSSSKMPDVLEQLREKDRNFPGTRASYHSTDREDVFVIGTDGGTSTDSVVDNRLRTAASLCDVDLRIYHQPKVEPVSEISHLPIVEKVNAGKFNTLITTLQTTDVYA